MEQPSANTRVRDEGRERESASAVNSFNIVEHACRATRWDLRLKDEPTKATDACEEAQ